MASEFTLVLYDGIPLNDPVGANSSYDFLDGLSLDGVKQIEVIRDLRVLFGLQRRRRRYQHHSQSGPASLGGSVLMEGVPMEHLVKSFQPRAAIKMDILI